MMDLKARLFINERLQLIKDKGTDEVFLVGNQRECVILNLNHCILLSCMA